MTQDRDIQKIIHEITQIKDIESLKKIVNSAKSQLAKINKTTRKTLYLIDKDNFYYAVTPKIDGKRKAFKLGKKLNRIEVLQQTLIDPPMPEDDIYSTWEKWHRLANSPRTIELGLSVEAAAGLERLEQKGFIIEIA